VYSYGKKTERNDAVNRIENLVMLEIKKVLLQYYLKLISRVISSMMSGKI
jgi:hypothetical protein